MRHILLAAASALALTIASGAAMASGQQHGHSGLSFQANNNALAHASTGGAAASSGSNALSDSLQLNNSNLTSSNPWTEIKVESENELSAHFGGHEMEVKYEGKKSGSGSISQSGNAFQNFAGINTMTQSTAQFNNNQAATSIAAYAPVNFGGGNTNN